MTDAKCFDDGVCHFEQLGQRHCRGICSIAVSRRHGYWENIVHAARQGREMAVKIVNRVEQHAAVWGG